MGEFINICASHCVGHPGGLDRTCNAGVDLERRVSRSAGNPVTAFQMTANLKGDASSGC